MNPPFTVDVVEEDVQLTLVELSRAVRAPEEWVRVWVIEGVLVPAGESPPDWRFAGASLKRARVAATLTRELELNAAGVAFALDLMDEIESLRGRLRHGGTR